MFQCVEGGNIQNFKYLKITMDKYVLHFDFHCIYVKDVDVIIGYPWMESIGTVNVNVKNTFINIWYKKNKIALHDVSLSKKEGTMGGRKEVIAKVKYIEGHE
jgi:hypothetical protein